MDQSSRQKISKGILTLNNTIEQADLKAIYRTFHPKATEPTFFQVLKELSPE